MSAPRPSELAVAILRLVVRPEDHPEVLGDLEPAGVLRCWAPVLGGPSEARWEPLAEGCSEFQAPVDGPEALGSRGADQAGGRTAAERIRSEAKPTRRRPGTGLGTGAAKSASASIAPRRPTRSSRSVRQVLSCSGVLFLSPTRPGIETISRRPALRGLAGRGR